MDLPILGVKKGVPVHSVMSDAEPHFFKFWDAEDVSNPFLLELTVNRTKTPILVSGSGPYIAMSKQPAVYFPRICDKLFIVNMVVRGAVAQVDPSRVLFFMLLSILVH